MSGLEVVGVVLGAFPLIISGLEHWRDVAKVSGFFWQIRKEYGKCRRHVQYQEIRYKRNLKELLLPVVSDEDEVVQLIQDPGGKGWSSKTIKEQLEGRLQESFVLYMECIQEMNETVEELRKELLLDQKSIQGKLAPPTPTPKKPRSPSSVQPSNSNCISRLTQARSKLGYEAFRVKFSFDEPVRDGLLSRLEQGNERLEKLLTGSDRISRLQQSVPAGLRQTSTLEKIFKKIWKRSDLLFKALHNAWQCGCQHHHIANLRLEHRIFAEICFDVILIFRPSVSYEATAWSWRELQCGEMASCSISHTPVASRTPPPQSGPKRPVATKVKKVAFNPPLLVEPTPEHNELRLCELLGDQNRATIDCMGVIGGDQEKYHLHPMEKRKPPESLKPLTLDDILNEVNAEDGARPFNRRQRYSVALLLASSVAQLQFTPWLRTGLTKEDVLFFPCEDDTCDVSYHEPFLRQGFPVDQPSTSTVDINECNFYSLGILLLELCFGRRLEEHPLRKRHPPGEGDAKQAFDLMAALTWSKSVGDEGGDDYASAVKWCFAGANLASKSWRAEIITNVVHPLEQCQKHFKTAGAF